MEQLKKSDDYYGIQNILILSSPNKGLKDRRVCISQAIAFKEIDPSLTKFCRKVVWVKNWNRV